MSEDHLLYTPAQYPAEYELDYDGQLVFHYNVKQGADISYTIRPVLIIIVDKSNEYLNIKPVTLRKWIKQKTDLPAHQIGKLWKFKRSELDEWVNSGKSATK